MLTPCTRALILITVSAAFAGSIAFADPPPASTPTPSQALDPAEASRIAASKYWHRLLHYRPASFFRGLRSKVDGGEFFFSSRGDRDPEAELRATVAAFDQDIQVGKLKQHPQCAFPERYRFLKSELKLSTKDVPCAKLDEFLSKFNAKSATLVFSSAYPNNPGSMFGHTFLRIDSQDKGDSRKLDLLDYGISYAAAVPDDENGLAFAVLGIAGGYPGQFAMVPYYAKVGEYINSESRDIWEYRLSVDRDETLRMLRHAWEIETNSYIAYYFLDENCALELLALLEIAKPEWDLLDFPLYVIPAETIKRLASIPGAITDVKFRPSLRKKMMARMSRLEGRDEKEFFELIRGERSADAVSSAAALDASMAYFFYEKQKNAGKLGDEQDQLLRETRIRRASLREPADESMMVFSEASRPDFGHFPARIGAAAGVTDGGADGGVRPFQEIAFKFAFHDLMNQDTGYIPFSQIDFPGMTVRHLPKHGMERSRLRVERVNGIAVTSLFPLTFVEKRTSWRFDLSWLTPKDTDCDYCRVFHFEGGAGASLGLAGDRAILYSLAMVQAQAGGGAFQKGYRFGPKLQAAAILVPQKDSKIRLAWNWIGDLAQSDRQKSWHELELEQSYALNRSWELRAGWLRVLRTENRSSNSSEAKLTLNHYF